MRSWILAATVVALFVRLVVLAGPLGELDADEAVVGLMARHIAFQGELPVFYYGQTYLGSLEAFSAAPLFLLFNSSAQVLKLVPMAYSLGFLILSALVARRLFGDGPAVLTAGYLALPPAMWALWSTKARGGYAEVLFLGEALLLITLWLVAARRPAWAVLLWGAVAGLALWTHLLAAVYIVPAGLFLLARRRTWSLLEIGSVAAGILIGAAPLWRANMSDNFATLGVMHGPAGVQIDPWGELLRFFRTATPMLAGVGRPIPPPTLALDLGWSAPTAGPLFLVVPLVLVLLGVLAWHAPSVRQLLCRNPGAGSDPALLVLLALAVPAALALTSYGYFVSEPRYALPLYSAVPLAANAVWRLPRALRWSTAAVVVVVNAWNIFATAVLLTRPDGILDTTPENRGVLVNYLVSQGRHQVYTDYSIAQTVMFESRELIQAAVISGGPNRYLPSADNVAQTANAVCVFLRDSEADQKFEARLREMDASARVATVDAYDVYLDVVPLDTVVADFE